MPTYEVGAYITLDYSSTAAAAVRCFAIPCTRSHKTTWALTIYILNSIHTMAEKSLCLRFNCFLSYKVNVKVIAM